MTASRVIFENQHYVASAMRDGSFIVQHKRTRQPKGLVLKAGPQADEWIKTVETAIDAQEANDLCRGFLA